MAATLLVLLAISADPTAIQTELLTTFRSEFVEITPGTGKFPRSFLMGREVGGHANERPTHVVTFKYDFRVAKYEVPQNLWEAVLGENPSRWKGARNSVEMLSFAEAQEFCAQATELMRAAKLIKADEVIRLPSEAEWEYVARAGTESVYSFGDDAKDLDDYGWHTGNAAGNDPPVGAKKPNAWGLYDVHGYLWEWCADTGHDSYEDAPVDGSAWINTDDTERRVLRGGSWKDKAEKLTSSHRLLADAELRDDAVGLRCVLAKLLTPNTKFRPTSQDWIIPPDARLEVVWKDGDFTEGPALAPDGSILFSDIGNTIYRFDPEEGDTTVYRKPSGRANGLMFDQKGRLIACEGANTGGGRRISITETDGSVRTLSDNFQGKRFNSPNDLAIDVEGRVYFTDPRYGGDEPRDLDFEGVFLVDTDGSTKIATRKVTKPNGILVSIDGTRVYVAENNPSGKRLLLLFDVQPDGTLAKRRALHDFGDGRGIDGMTLDREGNIYATAGRDELAGIYVFGPNGEHLAFLPTPGDPTNCVFGGGSENMILYITANGPQPDNPDTPSRYALYHIRLAKAGHSISPRQ